MSTENATIEPTVPASDLAQSKIPPATPDDAGNVTYTVTADQTTADPAGPTGAAGTPGIDYRRIKRGRHPEVTRGAFGNGRKHNGVKFRSSSLIRRFV